MCVVAYWLVNQELASKLDKHPEYTYLESKLHMVLQYCRGAVCGLTG